MDITKMTSAELREKVSAADPNDVVRAVAAYLVINAEAETLCFLAKRLGIDHPTPDQLEANDEQAEWAAFPNVEQDNQPAPAPESANDEPDPAVLIAAAADELAYLTASAVDYNGDGVLRFDGAPVAEVGKLIESLQALESTDLTGVNAADAIKLSARSLRLVLQMSVMSNKVFGAAASEGTADQVTNTDTSIA